MRVALLFIDGVGVGSRDANINPLAAREDLMSQFDDGGGATLPGGGRRVDLDTTFGLPGRPQSATNQTAILTGAEAPRLLGRHLPGYPNAPLRALLARESIVKRARRAGRTVTHANVYPAGWLDALGVPRRPSRGPDVVLPARRRARASASILAMQAGGVALRTLDDARRGEGLTHDIDGAAARRLGVDVPLRTPGDAAAILWRVAGDFTLFEHFLADESGHARDATAAAEALGTFDAFARAVVATRPDDALVLIVSDHGNVEDLSRRTHTTNRVALLSFGPAPALTASTVAAVGRLVTDALETHA